MTTYSLTLQIDATDLPALLAAGEQVVLARQFADAGNTVAWAALPPVQHRLVTWDDDYSLFASDTPNSVGNVISIASSTPATLRCDYRLDAVGFQGPTPDAALGPDSVQITNAMPATAAPAVLLGLAQAYGVDGGASGPPLPLNAQSVPALQVAQFTRQQNLWVYVASGRVTGMITPPPLLNDASREKEIVSSALLLPFDATRPNRTVRYSSLLGHFYPIP